MPDKEITREEAIYMITSYYAQNNKIRDINADCTLYPDGADISEWAIGMMNVALSQRLIMGSDDGRIYPKSTLTRAEAVMMIYNLIRKQ